MLVTLNSSCEINFYKLIITANGIQIDNNVTNTVKVACTVTHIHQCQKVIDVLWKKDANTYYLDEHGPVEFGVRFCHGLNDFLQCNKLHTTQFNNIT